MIKTVTVSGITTVDFDPEGAQPYFYAANKYVWIRNDSEDAMYASLSSTCTAGADGTAKISAGEAGMLILSPDNTIYISGSGAAEIRTGDTAECPFKTAAKGGDSSTAVKYTEQDLTTAQQAQARTNIGAANAADVPTAAQQAAWSAKQDALTFDSAPVQNSTNPVTSGGIYTALQGAEEEISELYAILGLYGNDVYGFQVDFENYIYTRLASAVGKTAGTDFNSFAPWSGMRRCNLADDGTVNAYYGDASYTEDGSNGQVMVEIPKFYYRVMPIKTDPIGGTVGGYHMRKGNYYISATKYPGFKTHPSFIKPDGTEVDKIYVSAYEGSIYDVSAGIYILDDAQIADFTAVTGDKLCSIAGAKPCSGSSQNLTRINAEQLAVNRGNGWHTLNSKAISAVQMLFAVEYASFNTQLAIGKGVVNKASGSGNEAVVTGGTSYLGNASGMADGTDGLVSVSYRGIENFWGNIWAFCVDISMYGDGTMRGGVPYICNNYNYVEGTTTGYSPTGFTVANASNFISAFGYNTNYDWLFIASETGDTADSNYPVGDNEYVTANLNGYCSFLIGGNWTSALGAGAFRLSLDIGSGVQDRRFGSRLIYV